MAAPENDLKEIVERIRHASDIVDVIGSYVPLTRAGSKFKACSPFNQEKTPSFFVDPGKQMFKCFSSGNGGDVFSFVMLYENLDFMGAVRRLGDRAKIEVPERGGLTISKEQKSVREQLYALHESVAAWWASLLHRDPQAEPARAYLKSRDFSDELAKEFGLGYAPESWDATLTWAKKKGYSLALLEQAGLVKTREGGSGHYDFFRGRLMIPVRNEIGKVVAFSGRLLDPEAKTAKYVNSPETLIFSKSRLLFGLDKTKKGILDAGHAILCEGQIDLMRLYSAGLNNAVAPQGTALTEHHAALLKRFTNEVVVCFDSDNAGRKAAVRSVEILLPTGLEIRIATLPVGDDPDSLIRRGGAEPMRALLAAAPPYYRYLLELVCRENDINSPKGRTIAARQMAEMVFKIASPTHQQMIGLEIATRLQIPYTLFQQELAQVKKSPSSTSANLTVEDSEPELEVFDANPLVSQLLSLLLTNEELTPHVQRDLNTTWLDTLEGGSLLKKLLNDHSHHLWEDVTHFVHQQSRSEQNYLAGLLLDPVPLPEEASLEDFAQDRVRQLRQLWSRQRKAFLEQEIKTGLLNHQQLMEKTKELLDLRRLDT